METDQKQGKIDLSEEEIQILIARVQDGDPGAFDEIYSYFARSVYQFVWFKVGHTQTAEDLTSHVFVKVWEAIGRYKPQNDAKFKTWLFQIARFTVIDHYRTRKQVDNIDDIAYKIGSDEDLAEEYGRNQDAVVVRDMISQLSEKYRAVLTLRFINDLSVRETAEILEKTEGHVRVLQHRALKKLQPLLKDKSGLLAFDTD